METVRKWASLALLVFASVLLVLIYDELRLVSFYVHEIGIKQALELGY